MRRVGDDRMVRHTAGSREGERRMPNRCRQSRTVIRAQSRALLAEERRRLEHGMTKAEWRARAGEGAEGCAPSGSPCTASISMRSGGTGERAANRIRVWAFSMTNILTDVAGNAFQPHSGATTGFRRLS
jgi:hypothetical protein